ncbi:PLP-dependent lyase/thiolase [Candidatus Peregrinibacteria bacterium]|nr:PLP-dependent lyase/thiolase [Candidatus Peregrinibacteria bacterium]
MKYQSGNTPLIKEEYFCKKFGLPNLFIKDESNNPFGTYKDRRSEDIVKKAIDEKIDKLALITSGNAGVSLAKFANGSNLKVVCIIDEKLSTTIYKKLVTVCYKVIRVDLSSHILKPKEIISLARETDEEVIWDITNGWHEAYENIIKEIKDGRPNFLITPVGSGEAFVGLFNGIKKYKLDTTLIGVAPKSSPSFADKLHTSWTPYTSKMESIFWCKHKVIRLSEETIKQAYSLAKNHIKCEPSSAIVFGVLSDLKIKKEDKIIVINSGRGLL